MCGVPGPDVCAGLTNSTSTWLTQYENFRVVQISNLVRSAIIYSINDE